MGRKNKINLRELVYEFEKENIWNDAEFDEKLTEQLQIDNFNKFEKIKHKQKHDDSDIGSFQFRKKKLNHTKRGQK